jgi:hypothetical protein
VIAGAVLINFAIFIYLINVVKTCHNSSGKNVQTLFIFTATIWLFVTSLVGLMLVYNFTFSILPHSTLYYLSLHAHLGIVGWFLLFITGVGSRLIPMFLISKYNNPGSLYRIYAFINAGLLLFVCNEIFEGSSNLIIGPVIFILSAIAMFIFYIIRAFKSRLRKQVDEPLQVSMISVIMMLLPPLTMIMVLLVTSTQGGNEFILAYGFIIFFGWITAIIFGMTFKTLPFIVWNMVYHSALGKGKVPAPKDLFSSKLFRLMKIFYLFGFLGFICGILAQLKPLMQFSSVSIAVSGVFYFINVVVIIIHKPVAA